MVAFFTAQKITGIQLFAQIAFAGNVGITMPDAASKTVYTSMFNKKLDGELSSKAELRSVSVETGTQNAFQESLILNVESRS